TPRPDGGAARAGCSARAVRGSASAVLTVCTLVVAGFLVNCGGADLGPPRIGAISLETGGDTAAIGGQLAREGVGVDANVAVTVGGVPAPILQANRRSALVRGPPGAPVGRVPVVAVRGSVASEPAFLEVRRLAYTANFTDLSLSVLRLGEGSVEVQGEIAIDVAPGPFTVAFTPD